MHVVTACRECLQAVCKGDNPWRTFVIAVGSVYVAKKALTLVLRYVAREVIREREAEIEEFEKDVVYLFTFPPGMTRQVPNLSPYAIKVETWLKLKNINYQLVPTTRFSADTKQLPYIRLNDQFVSDSAMIINYLTDYFKLDPSEGLTDEQLGVSRAFQRMVDDGLSWTYLIDRYTFRPALFSKYFQPRGNKYIREKIRAGLAKMFEVRANHQGTGRHQAVNIARMGMEDILAISRYLGDKPYMMGDKITKVDCAVFGHLSQIAFVEFPYAHKMLFNSGCENLRHYLYRIREKLWPDWFNRSTAGEFYQ